MPADEAKASLELMEEYRLRVERNLETLHAEATSTRAALEQAEKQFNSTV